MGKLGDLSYINALFGIFNVIFYISVYDCQKLTEIVKKKQEKATYLLFF